MKSLVSIAALVLLTVATDGQTCTNGKVYTNCGTYCPLTCQNKDNPPVVCPPACVVGCVCPSGMVEYNDGCVTPEDCPTTTVSKPACCQLPPVSGLCEAYMPSFFFNATSKRCESFVYGGCGGNDNRFQTKESCMESCGDQVSAATPSPEPAGGKPAYCRLPPVSGLCEAYMPSFFFNATSKRCESFVYGGCGGNDNRFQTKESCVESCGLVCKAGGIEVVEGKTRNDGCSECTCANSKIACTMSGECVNPIKRSLNIKMKFSGDYDVVSQDLEGFKLHFKTTLVTKYQAFNLQESQIIDINVYRGSIVVQITLEDPDEDEDEGLPDSANITLVVIHLEQDYNNNDLAIEYQDTTLEPSGELSYEDSDSDEDSECYSTLFYIGISVLFILTIIVLTLPVIGIAVLYMKKRRTVGKTPLPKDEVLGDEKVKGFTNPAYVKR